MINNTLAQDTLLKQRQLLIDEQRKMNQQYEDQIRELETALELLAGKQVWDNGSPHLYDDENPDYIRQSQEEI